MKAAPDTPVDRPPSLLDRIKGFLGDLARPWVLYVAAASSAIATVRIAWVGEDLSAGALYIAAAWSGVAALYGAKALEAATQSRHTASVEKAKVAAGPTPPDPNKGYPAAGEGPRIPPGISAVGPAEIGWLDDDVDPALFGGPRP